MREIFNQVKTVPALVPLAAAVADNTAQVGAIIDRRGFDSLLFAIVTGTLVDADATFTVLIEHGDAANLSDAAAVPDSELVGTEAGASFTFADDSKCSKIAYIGTKRYARLTITPAANASAAPLAAVAILGHPSVQPQSVQKN